MFYKKFFKNLYLKHIRRVYFNLVYLFYIQMIIYFFGIATCSSINVNINQEILLPSASYIIKETIILMIVEYLQIIMLRKSVAL
jgi:hypothetical protein